MGENSHKIKQSLFLQEFLNSAVVLEAHSDESIKKQYVAGTVTYSEKIHFSHIIIKGQQRMGR